MEVKNNKVLVCRRKYGRGVVLYGSIKKLLKEEHLTENGEVMSYNQVANRLAKNNESYDFDGFKISREKIIRNNN